MFEQSEDERRSEYRRSCNEHRTAELVRYDQWRASVRDYLATESQRRNQWLSRLESYLACLREKAMRLNMFLEDHPDCQILYSAVDGERVAEEHRKKAMASLKAIDQVLEEWRRRSEQEMPSHPRADQRSVAEPSEDDSQESLRTQIKQMAQAAFGSDGLECPVCGVQVKAKRLMQHYEKEHAQ